MEFHRVVVDLLGGALLQDAGEHRQGIGRVRRVGEAVDAGHDVVGLHLAAGVEFHTLAQLEGPHRAVVVRLPALGQCRLEHEVRAIDAEEFGNLLHDQKAAGVGDGDRVDGCRRHAAGDADGGAGCAAARASDGMPPKPAAVVMPPRSGSDRPSRLPWRMKSRRLTRPSTRPSMRWFSSGERLRRIRSRMR